MKRKTTMFLLLVLFTSMMGFAQDDVQYDQYGMEVKSKPVSGTVRDGILVFETKDKDYKIWFDTRVQADFATFFGQDDDYDDIGNGASIRRARFAVKAQITPSWYGEIDMDVANGSLEIKDAYLMFTGLKDFEMQIGNFKEGFSMQRNTSSRNLQFIERAMVTYLAPSRHIGAQVKYSIPVIWGAAGAFLHELEGQEALTYVQDNNKDYGRNSGYSYTGKLVVRPLYKYHQDFGVHVGGAISYRTPKSSDDPADWGGVRHSTRNSTSINRKKYLDTDVIKGADHELRYTAELAGHYKGLRFESAYIGTTVSLKDDSPETNKDDKHFGGFYVQAGYLLFGGKQNYDENDAEYTRVTRGKKWGDIELVARYEYLSLNDFNAGIYGGAGEAYTVGLNFYVNNNVKFQLNYQYNNNDRYANGKNKLFVGHDANGEPTKDYTKVTENKGKGGVDYSMLALRCQIAF